MDIGLFNRFSFLRTMNEICASSASDPRCAIIGLPQGFAKSIKSKGIREFFSIDGTLTSKYPERRCQVLISLLKSGFLMHRYTAAHWFPTFARQPSNPMQR